MKQEIDTTKPHIGRVYDYLLGGTQNFEADRQAAEALLKIYPNALESAQVHRWFLQYVANRWAEEGHKQILDLGSGLPTQGHFNEYLPDARILFSDVDALTVEYAQDLLKDRPNMRYVQADVRDPAPLMKEAVEFFGNNRRVAIGCIGIGYFLPEDLFVSLVRSLADFSAPGSVLAMTYFLPPVEGTPAADFLSTYTRLINVPLYPRSPELVAQLLAPWRVVEDKLLEKWLSVDHSVEKEHLGNQRFEAHGLIAVR